MDLRLASILALSMVMLGATLQVTGSSSAQMELRRLNSVVAEAERRCAAKDIDGATKTLGLWYRPSQPSISTEQVRRLLDTCLARFGKLGEVGSAPKGSHCMFESAQCNWAKQCLDNKNCESAPVKETVELLEKSAVVSKTRQIPTIDFEDITQDAEDYFLNIRGALNPQSWESTNNTYVKMQPGEWVHGCDECNLAMTLSFLGMNNKELPIFERTKAGDIFWDKVVPLMAEEADMTGDERLDAETKSTRSKKVAAEVNKAVTEELTTKVDSALESLAK